MNQSLTTTVDLVRQYGGPVSHAALDPSRCIFRTPAVDGLISFMLVNRCAVVMGDPICAPAHKALLADAFAGHCAENRWSILYVAATAGLQAYARERGYTSIEFADLLIADPQNDPEEGHQARHLRQHLNHARRDGVTVREYLGESDAQIETQAHAACEAWLSSRHGLQMYLGRPQLFNDKTGRRWFIAEKESQVIGFLSMLRVGCSECRSLINLVFSSPSAPLYTSELMVISALKTLREEGANSVCMGIGPRTALGRFEGCGVVMELLSRKLYRLAEKLTHQHGKTAFWEKFRVAQKDPLYLLFQPPGIGPGKIYALIRALHFSITG